MVKRIGILTGGGDCGGINATIESTVRSAIGMGWEVDGIENGWEGAIFDDRHPLRVSDVEGVHADTGTILGTTRTNPYKFTGELGSESFQGADVSGRVIENAKRAGLEAVIAIGGNDTLSVIRKCEGDGSLRGLSVEYDAPLFIGVPKTMDGDLQRYSLGLDSAINRAMQVIRDFIPVLKANRSIGFVELFGRDVGRVAFKAGIASGADVILIPEIEIDIDYLVSFIANRFDERAKSHNGATYVVVIVAEGAYNPITGKKVYLNTGEDSFGHGKLGGVGEKLAKIVHDRLKDDPRIRDHTKRLGIKNERPTYDVRGGETLYSDSYIGQKLGAAAIQAIVKGVRSGMAVVNLNEHGQIELMPIEMLIEPRQVHMSILDTFERRGLYCFGRVPLDNYDGPTLQVVSKR